MENKDENMIIEAFKAMLEYLYASKNSSHSTWESSVSSTSQIMFS
jgi:hypothetical protein